MRNHLIAGMFGVIVPLAMLAAPSAQATAVADTFSSSVTNPNDAISGYAAPYAEVLVTLTSPTTATVTFTSDTVGGNIYLMGDGSSAGVNVNATTFTITGVTGSNAGTGFTPGPYTVANPPGTSNVDGWGSFNGVIDSFDGFTHSSDTISFTLTDVSGTWSSASNVLTPNANGCDAETHVFVTSSPANAANGAVATGFACEGTNVINTPEPSGLAVLGVALLAFGLLLTVRRQKAA